MPEPKKNTAYAFVMGLVDTAARPSFRVSPTLALGDFKVSIDGGALANLGTTPVVDPAGSSFVKVSLSAAEMNGDRIAVHAKDAAGSEWDEVIAYIDTTTQTVDDVASSAALATVQADTDDIQTRLPAALVGGRMDSSVGAMAVDVLTAAALNSSAAEEIADALLDRTDGIEGGANSMTLRQAMRIVLSAAGGPATGLEGNTARYRDVNNSKNRIQATVDVDGNRSGLIYDKT